MRAVAAVSGAVLVGLLGCQAFVDGDAAGGIGAPCAKDSECQASECSNGTCTLACKQPSDCPKGTACTSAKHCELTLKAAWIYDSNPADEQWTAAHELGRLDAAKQSFVTAKAFPNVELAALPKAVDDAVGEGYHVIFATAPDFAATIRDKATQYPGTQFFTCGAGGADQNNGVYFGRIDKAWYLAGIAAATRSKTQRLGIIGSYVTPSVVRNINAFALGAASVNPMSPPPVEVRWAHVWQDSGNSQFVTLAQELLATGCDVIAHQGYRGYTVDAVEKAMKADTLEIGNNAPDACDPATAPHCFATVYWNWGPLYAQILQDVHSNAVAPAAAYNPGIQVNPVDSVPNFKLASGDLDQQLSMTLGTLAGEGEGIGTPLGGEFCTTEPLDAMNMKHCFGAANPMSVEVFSGMCFFVEGVVEKDMMSIDVPAQVPQEGDCKPQM